MIAEQDIREFGRRIVRDFQPGKIILFGSYAEGQAGPNSDVDLLVILTFEGKNFLNPLEILNRTNPGFPIDLLARRPDDTDRSYREGDPLIRAALDRGKVLYECHG